MALINAVTCMESELSAYFLRNREETRFMQAYDNDAATMAEIKRDWFLKQPFTHDVLFHVTPKSSVLDRHLRLQLLREAKREAGFKDIITFTFLSFFVPKIAIALSGVNLVRNLALNFDLDERSLTALETAEVGKYSRVFAFVLPLASLF